MKLKNHYHDELEARAMFSIDSNISENEAFEILDAEGIDEITWSEQLNNAYANWQYLNIK